MLERKWNTTATVFGVITCIGISLVANFQETSVITVHFLGAVLAFGAGSLYLIIQVKYSYITVKQYLPDDRQVNGNLPNLTLRNVLAQTLIYTSAGLEKRYDNH